MPSTPPQTLLDIAKQTLLRFGFLIQPPAAALAEATALVEPNWSTVSVKDLTALLWSSIDNDDSRDLDQIEVLVKDPKGTRLLVGIADVAASVAKGSALDQAAWQNTTSLYTGIRIFPLFPERLSTNLTSLLENQKRLALVIDILFAADGSVIESTVYPAVVCNQAQLTYLAVAAWFENQPGDGSPVSTRMLEKIRARPELQEQLRAQQALAQQLRSRRTAAGALTFETIEMRPTPTPDGHWDLQAHGPDEATKLIEDFMIAANQETVKFLQSKNFSTLRRVVRTPKNWPRIVELAKQKEFALPAEPDVQALEAFLTKERQSDPDHFPDLSLSVIKLLGRGEYVVATPGVEAPGHFSLAIGGYSHSTAPNRRYPDLLTQRLLKAAIAGTPAPYSVAELTALATHCTQKEDDANKAERSVTKTLAAAAMASMVGQSFDGFITGASDKGIWVRIVKPPVEGRVDGAPAGLAVGDRLTVKLTRTDPTHGYIDFAFLQKRQ